MITTVIPVHNGAQYIAQAIRSLTDQVQRPDRIVVLDNASTDRTRAIVGPHDGVELIEFDEFVGPIESFNRAPGA